MTVDDKNEKKYELALQMVNNESHVVWQYSQGFILANTIIIGFIAQNLNASNQTNLILAIGGFIISLIWLGHSERRWAWYVFRMAQAKEAEKNTKGFDFIGEKTGQKFSKGEYVGIGEEGYRLNLLARLFDTLWSTRIFIILFLLFYFGIILANQNVIRVTIRKSNMFGNHYQTRQADFYKLNKLQLSPPQF